MQVRVLLVDDSDGVRKALRMFLELDPDLKVVGEATNGNSAVEMARTLCPDVTVMDVRMPVMDGLTATAHILHDKPASRVLLLSSADSAMLKDMALRAGAVGYFAKNMDPALLGDEIKRAALATARS